MMKGRGRARCSYMDQVMEKAGVASYQEVKEKAHRGINGKHSTDKKITF